MLTETLKKLALAEQAKDEAKARWMELSAAGDERQFDARQEFWSADSRYAACAQELAGEISCLNELDMLAVVVDALESGLRACFRRLVAALGFERMVLSQATAPSLGLAELVGAWRRAARVLEAAQRMNQLRLAHEPDAFQALLDDGDAHCDRESWEKAAVIFRLFLSLRGDSAEPVEERLRDAGFATVAQARRSYDKLTEQLQTLVERLMESNMLAYELDDMDVSDRRCLQDAISGGLVRQRQTQAQTQPERPSRAVTTLPPPDEE